MGKHATYARWFQQWWAGMESVVMASSSGIDL